MLSADETKNNSTYKREKPNKVVIIGDSNVGKTCIIERYVEDRFGDTQPTIGALHKIKTVNDIQLDIWDTAGQERFKSMVPMYYKGAKAIIIAFDVTTTSSFDGAKKWLTEIESNTSNITIVLLANKIDLNDLRLVSKETAQAFAQGKNITYYETSAKDNLNIKEVFDFIASKIKEMNIKSDSLQLNKNTSDQAENKSSCLRTCG